MKAAHGIGNMVLAHEIAVDGDVQLQRNEPPPDRYVDVKINGPYLVAESAPPPRPNFCIRVFE